MGHQSRTLASLMDDLHQSRGQLRTLEVQHGPGDPGELRTLASRDAEQAPHTASSSSQNAPRQLTHDEMFNHLVRLADDYHLPRKLVYAAAAAESDFDVGKVSKNFVHDKRRQLVKDKHGSPVVKSIDYGLMQINSRRINHDVVKDSAGHKMKITDAVTKDWKTNAEVGVATLKHDFDLVSLSEPPGTSSEDIALATYSAYNHGSSHWHKFVEKDKNGVPKDSGVHNFYNRYKVAPDR
jgi:soluble lytic murein transglycosylase-like protein